MFVDKIFERATIRGIADYLLFGIGLDKDNIVSVSYIRNTL